MSFSKTAQDLQSHKDQILQTWLKEVKAQVEESRNLVKPIMINTLPALLDNLAEELSPEHPRQLGSFDSTLAQEHGGERARLTNFDITALIQEYRILRHVIISTLGEVRPLDKKCEQLIHVFIDEAIQASATSFSLVQAGMRDQMIATLTHDMRSPITAASLAADMIGKKTNDEVILKNVRKIKDNHRRIDNLIQALLDTNLIRAGGKLQLNVDEVEVSKLLNELYELLPPSQEHRLEIQTPDITGWWDKEHLRRALENLISNAFKYGDPEKNISIDVKEKYERVIFSIHNHGPHIPKEEQEAIFQVFRRAEAAKSGKRKGWGLGLPMARTVAEAHAGSIGIESFKDHGTTFILDIPKDVRPFYP